MISVPRAQNKVTQVDALSDAAFERGTYTLRQKFFFFFLQRSM